MTNPVGLISMQIARPFTEDHFPWLRRLKALGFDFIELLVPEAGDVDLKKLHEALTDAELDVVLAARVNMERNLTSSDATCRQSGRDYLKYAIECAHTLGARIVGGPLYGNPLVFAGRAPQPIDEALRAARENWCVEGLKAVAPFAAQAGVTLAVEPLNRFETDILCTTRQGTALIDLVGEPSVGLMLDTFHMHMEDASIPEAIVEAGPRIAHFQANENHRGFLGTGATDWVAVARALHAVGYAGPIALEPFRRDDDRIAVPIAQWRPPHEDETEKLAASLALLKNAMTMGRYRR
ncbi:sugar phosphate isomerase/epimerase family protein [Chelativorans sp. M5D2P16]|uniref:sugar phosphate isomerase/epimerase family protein n=1 Tax=Chelativorans sp. M5D2P16 TaxID=3095678 RepID=UPI002ACA86E3|nr:sugar phosphate isomerase/epimerase family protein [Chelativorans sp. M5D2P16]MDZ5699716.1 sugar phosphate isomerase/epimerase family protein [Chelativorans sp. M5D2P16]